MQKGWGKVKKAGQHAGVSERTVWTWMSQGLPYAKVNGTCLINFEDLDAFIRKHTVKRNYIDRIVEDVLQSMKNGG